MTKSWGKYFQMCLCPFKWIHLFSLHNRPLQIFSGDNDLTPQLNWVNCNYQNNYDNIICFFYPKGWLTIIHLQSWFVISVIYLWLRYWLASSFPVNPEVLLIYRHMGIIRRYYLSSLLNKNGGKGQGLGTNTFVCLKIY